MVRLAKFLTAFLFVSLILGQFARIPLFSSRLYFFDIFSLVFATFSILVHVRKKASFSFVTFTFICFTIWAAGSLGRSLLIYNYPDISLQAFYLIRLLLYLISAMGIVCLVNSNYYSYTWLLKLIMSMGLLVSLAGFIQLLVLPDFSVLDPAYGWDPHKNRLASTFFDPNFVGAFLVCTLTIYLGMLYVGKLNFWRNWIYSIFFFLLPLLALFLTFSRSAWLMFAVVVLVFGVLKYRFLLIMFALMCFLIYFAVPRVQTRLSGVTDPQDSAHYRLSSWGNTLTVAKTEPVFGVGFNSFRYAQKDLGFFSSGNFGGNSGAGSDSSGLLILATTGSVGFILFCLGYAMAIYKSFVHRKQGGIIGFAILLALVFESIFINSLFYPQILLIWLVFAFIPHESSRFDILH